MTDEQVDQVLQALDELWVSREKLSRGACALWGAKLVKHDYQLVMQALMTLLETSKWRPSLAEVIGELRASRRQRAIAADRRLALAAPEVPVIPPERVAAVLAPFLVKWQYTKEQNMARAKQCAVVGGAVGTTSVRRRWGAMALQILCERLETDSEFAADVLDEVARRTL